MGNIEKTLKEIISENELVGKIILLISDLSEKKDRRLPEIIEAYSLIRKTEDDVSRIPWKFLEYFETNHRDLYRKIQMIDSNPRI